MGLSVCPEAPEVRPSGVRSPEVPLEYADTPNAPPVLLCQIDEEDDLFRRWARMIVIK